MTDFSHRSYKKEILDSENIPFDAIQKNMKELDFINTYLGGHNITIKGLKSLLSVKDNLTICEIGCGGGDNLNAIKKWCYQKNIRAKFIGVDINSECIKYANGLNKNHGIEFQCADYKNATFGSIPDIIFSSLFTHHFTNDQLINMIQWMQKNSRLGFFINDLHRHPLPYNFIKFFTKMFSNSYLVKNDAPLSVLRSFKENEWKSILNASGIENYTIQWCWAFRYLIIVENGN